MNARKPTRLVLELADPPHVLDPLLESLDVAVHHRRGRRHAEPVCLAHHLEPLVGRRLLRRDDRAHAIDEDLRTTARERVQAGIAQPCERLRDGELRPPGDVLHLRRRQRVEMDLVARLDRPEEILVVVDPEVRMVPSLHEDARAADRKRLLDLLVDDRLREEVGLALVARPPVEGAEVAVRDTDVRVVQVPVDDERDPVRVREAVADLVRDPADGDEVAGAQQRDCVLVRKPLSVERLLEDVAHMRGRGKPRPYGRGARHAGTSSRTKRSSGTCGSSPASRAISRNV